MFGKTVFETSPFGVAVPVERTRMDSVVYFGAGGSRTHMNRAADEIVAEMTLLNVCSLCEGVGCTEYYSVL
jgi:hypothetical protein